MNEHWERSMHLCKKNFYIGVYDVMVGEWHGEWWFDGDYKYDKNV